MLLRSSSTPVLGSLLSSFTDSPNHSLHSETKHMSSPSISQYSHKLCSHQTGFLLSCNSSPISPSIDFNKGFRRAQSEGNLQDLAFASCSRIEEDQHCDLEPPKWFSARPKYMTLETIPSFSRYNYKGFCEEDEEEESDVEEDEEREELGEKGNGLSLENRISDTVLTEKLRVEEGICGVRFAEQQEMYAARGLGIGGCSGGRGGGGGGYNSMGSGGDEGDRQEVEEYYKKMVEENPGNPLFLRNYAQFLHQHKRDCEGAEEYYSRAILVDPKDGEVLSEYAKLVWELHHDQDRASSYFERAVQASPQDSHVHAAYASFLWDTEEGDDTCEMPQSLPPHTLQEAIASAGA